MISWEFRKESSIWHFDFVRVLSESRRSDTNYLRYLHVAYLWNYIIQFALCLKMNYHSLIPHQRKCLHAVSQITISWNYQVRGHEFHKISDESRSCKSICHVIIIFHWIKIWRKQIDFEILRVHVDEVRFFMKVGDSLILLKRLLYFENDMSPIIILWIMRKNFLWNILIFSYIYIYIYI